MAPRGLHDVIGRTKVPSVRALGCRRRRQRAVTDTVLFRVPRQVQFVPLGNLPRKPRVVMPVRVVVDGRTAQIRLVNPGRGVLVVEEAGHKPGVAPPAWGRKEPELVLQDRAAERPSEVVAQVDGTAGGQATG